MPTRSSAMHPGKTLSKRLRSLGLTPAAFAAAIGVSPKRVRKLIKGRKDVTAGLSLRLGRFFGEAAESWLLPQMRWDLILAQRGKNPALTAIKPHQASKSKTTASRKALKRSAKKAPSRRTPVRRVAPVPSVEPTPAEIPAPVQA